MESHVTHECGMSHMNEACHVYIVSDHRKPWVCMIGVCV